MEYLEFLDAGHRPSKTDLVCTFRVSPLRGISLREAAARVASESSVGTWSRELKTETEKVKKRLSGLYARAFSIKGNTVKIAYPIGLWEPGNMPQILSGIAGNVFGMKAVRGLRLEDVEFPERIIKSFKGPQFGIDGIRKIFKEKKRPLTATVPKPKIGLNVKEHAEAGYKAWIGGMDLLKDDENLTDQSFNSFRKRVKLSLKMRDKAEKETGEKKSYLINITSETREMLRRAKFVRDQGGEYIMLDIITAGFSAFQTVRDECHDLRLAIHCHRAMHAAFDRVPSHGISMLTLSKITRLIGGDQLHTGTANIGKLESLGGETQVMNKFLQSKWFNVKTTFPVASGGIHPGTIPEIMRVLGRGIIIQCGGGLWGHPGGYEAGAKAIRQAIDASMEGTSLEDYAKTHAELEEALREWGHMKPL